MRSLKRRFTSAGLAVLLVLSSVTPAYAAEMPNTAGTAAADSGMVAFQTEDGLVLSYGGTDEDAVAAGDTFGTETDAPGGLDAGTGTEVSGETETEAVTEAVDEAESESEVEAEYIVYLPEMEGVSYTYDEEAYDGELSGDDYSILVYNAGDEVGFQVESSLAYELVYASSGEAFGDAVVNDGDVSFVMPQFDLALAFIPETDGAGQEEAVTDDQGTEQAVESGDIQGAEFPDDVDVNPAPQEEFSDGDGPVITADGSDGITYEFDKDAYAEGDLVRFTVKADAGFLLDEVTAEMDDGGELDMELVEEDTITNDSEMYAIDMVDETVCIITQQGDLGNTSETYEFVMPGEDVSINAIRNDGIMLILDGVPSKHKYNVTEDLGGLPSSWVNQKQSSSGMMINPTGTFRKTVTFTKGSKDYTRPAFCLQPKLGAPDSGDSYTMKEATSNKLKKALFWMYGGPGWNDSPIKDYMKNNGCTIDGQLYGATHMVLAYIYDNGGSSWDDAPAYTDVVNSTGKKYIAHMANMLDDLALPVNGSISKTSITGTYNTTSGKLVTESVKYTGTAGTTAKVTAEKGVTIVNDTTKASSKKTATINAGDSFHFEKAASGESGSVSYTLDTQYPIDFVPIVMDYSSSKLQNLGVTFYSETNQIKLNVSWQSQNTTVSVRKHMGSPSTGVFGAISAAYSFQGAKYGVYSDAGCTHMVAEITINADGNGASAELPQASAYYVKEIQAPTNGAYLIDTAVYTANAANNWTIDSYDPPKLGSLTIHKSLKAMEGMTEAEKQALYNKGILANVQFRLQHENAAALGAYGVKIVKCDKYGVATVTDMVSGKWTISEISAPSTYYRTMPDDTVYIDTSRETWDYGNVNTTHEGWIQLIKKDPKTGNTITLNHATFQIYKFDDLVTGQWVGPIKLLVMGDKEPTDKFTTNSAGVVNFGQALEGGRYKVTEISSPYGYEVLTDAVEFQITADNDATQPVEVQIAEPIVYGKLRVTKVDKKTGKNCGAGYKFNVYVQEDIVDGSGAVRSDDTAGPLTAGKLVQTITTSANGIATSKDLYVGKYYVQEAAVSGDGHVLNTEKYPFEVTGEANNHETKVVDVKIANEENHLDLYKTDSRTGAPLEGVTFRIKMKDAKDDDSQLYVTGKDGHFGIDGLPAGEYTAQEVKTLPGYNLNKDVIKFTVGSDCLINGKSVFRIDVENVSNELHISKRNIVDQAELPGAKLKITDANGKVVDEWTSTTEEHVIYALPAGEYTLTEVLPPEYFEEAASVKFTVTDSLEVQKAVMDDIPYRDVQISKQDITNNKELPGAKLTLHDAQGNQVDSWTSTDKPHMIKLHSGRYTLTEDYTPLGYVTSRAVTFEVKPRGRNDYDVQTVTMVDDITKVKISKQDITNEKELPGATLRITDAAGELVDEWVSTDEPHYMEKLPVGEYVLTEVAPPEYYEEAESIEFSVFDTGEVQFVEMSDKPYREVELSKTDITNGSELPGARLSVRDSDGKVVDEWTSTDKPHKIRLHSGRYTLTEDYTPIGYVTAKTVKFEVLERGWGDFDVQHVEMVDDVTKLRVSKKDITNKEELPGATLRITDMDGNVIDEWVSTEEPHYIEKIPIGKYVLTEVKEPELYEEAESIEFEIPNSGEIQYVEMSDKPYRDVEFSKKDITNNEELPDAHLTLRDSSGDVVDEWVSTDEPHKIPLHSGKYTLEETKPADGYVTAESVTFDVLERGEGDFDIQHVDMFDDITKTMISKQNMAGDEEVPGAHLEITDADGVVMDEWVSTVVPHYIEKLPIGKYTLTETQAPDGYTTSESVEFEVLDTGDIQTFVMHDDVTKVEISKQNMTGDEEIPGAHLEIRDEAGEVVEEWVSGDTPHYIEKLPVGRYTLTETQAPDGYVTAETIEFEVADTGEIQQVVMHDDVTKVEISKQDMTGGEEIPGAHLEIRDEDGRVVEEWVSGEEPHYIEKLPVGRYSLTETQAPDGYVTAETIEFEVADTGEIQQVVMHDDITRVEISKQDVTDSKELPGARLVIKDEEGNEVEEWVSTNEPHYIEMLPVGKYTLTEITAPAGYDVAETVNFEVLDTAEIQHVVMYDSPTPAPVPQTGDDFNAGQLAVIIAAVIVLLGAALLVLRRRTRRA